MADGSRRPSGFPAIRVVSQGIAHAVALCPEHPTLLPHAWGRRVLAPAATYCSLLRPTAACCDLLQPTAAYCSLLRLLQREADLQRHLVLDARCCEPPALLLHLEP